EEDDEDDDDDDEPSVATEGAYDPAEYANLPVSTEIKDLFQYITRYSCQPLDLDHSLKPFIPDFIPAVGDIDAFLKVPRPDGAADHLGLLVLDEPSVKQSDPTVMSLWLSEESKQHAATQLQKVTSVASPHTNPRQLDSWVDSISALHRSKTSGERPVRPADAHHRQPDAGVAGRGGGAAGAPAATRRRAGLQHGAVRRPGLQPAGHPRPGQQDPGAAPALQPLPGGPRAAALHTRLDGLRTHTPPAAFVSVDLGREQLTWPPADLCSSLKLFQPHQAGT
ncbi:unnamed protein product, partial [Tetraodon nigroviridis]